MHRDLKPTNVLVTTEGHLKLCDFGVAKVLTGSTQETLGGLLVGTPEYMAPEQAHGEARDAGPAANVYALGTNLYAILTGRPPFQSASVLETLEQVRSQEPVPPRRLQPSVPRRPADDLLEMPAEGAATPIRQQRRPWPRTSIGSWPAGRSSPGRRPCSSKRGSEPGAGPPRPMLVSAIAATAVLGFTLVVWQWRCAETKADAEADANQRAAADAPALAGAAGRARPEAGFSPLR